MPAVSLSPIFNADQLFTSAGVPLAGGLLNTYLAGTTTPVLSYTDSGGTIANANPIVLDSAGRPPFQIWLILGTAYKFVLTDSLGANPLTFDNIVGIGAATTGSGSFTDLTVTGNTLLGDAQTDTLNVGNGDIVKDNAGYTGFGVSPTAGQGKVQLAGSANGGIKLGNQNNTYANSLDWYEESNGVYTPLLLIGGINYTGTYSSQVCNYTRIGNRVSGEILIQLNTLAADVGQLAFSLASFPYPPITGVSYPCPIRGQGLNMASPFVLFGDAAPTRISLFNGSALGGTNAQNTILQNGCSLAVQFNFRCA